MVISRSTFMVMAMRWIGWSFTDRNLADKDKPREVPLETERIGFRRQRRGPRAAVRLTGAGTKA